MQRPGVENWLSAVLGVCGKYSLGLEALQPWKGQKGLGENGDDHVSLFIAGQDRTPLLTAQA